MRSLLKKYFTTTVSIYCLTQIIPSVTFNRGWPGLLTASFILGILLYIARPIVNLIMLPINLLTLNLSSWIINILIFYIWTILTPDVNIAPWRSSGFSFGPIMISEFNLIRWQIVIFGGIVTTILLQLFDWLLK